MAGPADRAIWAKRSVHWLPAAPEGKSSDDAQNQALIAAAGIGPGARVLDLASGTGEPSISIALRVGAEGAVVATDFSSEMLGGVRRRAMALGLDQMAFTVADMTQLPFSDDGFDAVTCRMGLMFPTDRVAAASEARRVLMPGAKAAYMVWGPLEDNTMHANLDGAVREFFGDPVPTRPPKRHELGGEGAISAVLNSAGFADVEEREIRGVREITAERAYWRGRIMRNHSERYYGLDDAGRLALEQAVADAFAPCAVGGAYALEQHVRIGIGTAPA